MFPLTSIPPYISVHSDNSVFLSSKSPLRSVSHLLQSPPSYINPPLYIRVLPWISGPPWLAALISLYDN